MDWALATEINRKDLARIVAGLFAMVGLVAGALVPTVPRWMHSTVLEVLRPAESAARRLVAVLANEIVIAPKAARQALAGAIPKGSSERIPAFRLFDPRKNVDPKAKQAPGFGPNVRGLCRGSPAPPAPRAPLPDDPMSALRLCRRLLALQGVLDDLPGQARRLARALAKPGQKYLRVMRPGRPPGFRARQRHPVDAVLVECHELALLALHPANAP